MSEYNVNNDLLGKSGEKKPNYMMAALAGLGVSVLVAIALAAIGILLEAEYIIALIIGAVLVGVVIHNFVPNKSIGGAILGAILCPATYFYIKYSWQCLDIIMKEMIIHFGGC